MGFFDSALALSDATRASMPRRNSAYAAIAVGVATLLAGTATFAADERDAGAENKAVTDAAAAETTSRAETTGTQDDTEARANDGAKEADHHHGSDAKHKGKDKAHKGGTSGDVDSEVVVTGKQEEKEQPQKCVQTKSTGSRLQHTHCYNPSQQKANDKHDEQQAQDYLRQASQRATIAPASPGPFINSGIP